MKLIKCHIENFGVLSDYSVEFTDGLNVLYEENGFGKTTLADFIKAMFYGLITTNKRKVSENNRVKYLPWQGGIWGGTLDFSVGDKSYRIYRRFAKKATDDEFKLLDPKTGDELDDYSEKIGEELFSLDESAFEHSTYLPQKILDEKIPFSISSKLTSLVDNTDDLSDFDRAISSLDERRKFYVKTGNKGAIAELRDEIFEINRSISACESTFEVIDTKEAELKELKSKSTEIKKTLDEMRAVLTAAATSEANEQKKKSYQNMLSECEALKKQLEAIKSDFKNGLPDDNTLETLKTKSDKINKLQSSISAVKLQAASNNSDEYNSFFKDGVPSEETLSNIQNKVKRYNIVVNNLENSEIPKSELEEYNSLKTFFLRGVPSDEKIAEIKEKANKISTLKTVNVNQGSKNSKFVVLLITALVLIAAGVGLGFVSLLLGIAVSTVGAVLLIASIVVKLKSKDTDTASNDELIRLNTEVSNFIRDYFTQELDINDAITNIKVNHEKYLSLGTKINQNDSLIKSMTDEKNQLSTALSEFFGKYFFDSSKSYDNMLDELKSKISSYNENKKTLDNATKSVKQYEDELKTENAQILKLFADYGIVNFDVKNYDDWCNILTQKVIECKNITAALQEKIKKTNEFAQSEKIADLSETKTDLSLEEAEKRQAEAQDEYELILDRINKETIKIKELSKETEYYNEYLSLREQKEELLETYIKNYANIAEAVKLLKKAKEQITKKYLSPMEEGFKKYSTMLKNDKAKEFFINTELTISIVEQGAKRDFDYFSTGYRNLINLCMRFALTDALFEKEKPFIILDDPFINLDDKRLETALEALRILSKEKQIIYMVCNRHRSIE